MKYFFGEREITEVYCHDFSQKFRQINVLQKNFTLNWFDGKKIEVRATVPQCGKMRNSFSPKIFCEIKSLLTSLVKPLISRNFCQK